MEQAVSRREKVKIIIPPTYDDRATMTDVTKAVVCVILSVGWCI